MVLGPSRTHRSAAAGRADATGSGLLLVEPPDDGRANPAIVRYKEAMAATRRVNSSSRRTPGSLHHARPRARRH